MIIEFLLAYTLAVAPVGTVKLWQNTLPVIADKPVKLYIQRPKLPNVQFTGDIPALIAKEFKAAGYSDAVVATMTRIAKCESNFQAGSVNRSSGAAGVFQFMPSTGRAYGLTDPLNAEQNVKAAVRLYSARGTQPWACR